MQHFLFLHIPTKTKPSSRLSVRIALPQLLMILEYRVTTRISGKKNRENFRARNDIRPCIRKRHP